MRQSDIFLRSEADRWLERNRDRLGVLDPVGKVIDAIDVKPQSVLEVGCSNGWRLDALRDKYGCKILGVDPSLMAAEEGAARNVPIFTGTAAALPIRRDSHDLVIFGFCLYLADPADWFTIAGEADRVLKPGGHLIIHDFAALDDAFARVYEHCDGVMSYHVDFAEFWLANPLYTMAHRRVFFEDEMVTVLQKQPLSYIEVLP